VNPTIPALPVLVVAVAMIVAPAAPHGQEEVFRFDEQVTESSGLVDLGDRVLTVNDSGDDAIVYVVDPRSGETVGRTTYAEEVEDVEAITTGPDGDVWVGDIGDNAASRTGIRVHRIERPGDGDRRVESTSYELVYRGGARDAETLLVSPRGRLLLVSKGFLAGQVWQAPASLREDRPNVLRRLARVGGMVTDGAWFPDGRHVVLRDYESASVYEVTGSRWRRVGGMRLPEQGQGEGIAVRDDGSLLISSEGRRKPVLAVPLPAELSRKLDPESDAPRSSPAPGEDAAGRGDGEVPGTGLGAAVEGGGDARRIVGAVVTALLLVVLGWRLLRLRRRDG
jgi:hypothetical protein